MKEFTDTIVAQATPLGIGGIGILRISGINAYKVAKYILGKIPKPRYAEYLSFMDYSNGDILDKGIALWFPNPHSFTGEDVLELHAHGGPIILDIILNSILLIPDIRIANPGEFSKRAFLNKKIDLLQAEAISDLIQANSETAARAALNSLQGIFSKHINELLKKIIELRTSIELDIDFSEDNILHLDNKEIQNKLSNILDNLHTVKISANQGCILREGIKIVITGKPNAGKSSLFNALSGRDIAIVTDLAGTTRDILQAHINIDGIPLHLIDTAGLRESSDQIENIGINRAWQEIKDANHLLFIVDASTTNENNISDIWPNFMQKLPTKLPVTIVRNKIDITGEKCGLKKWNNVSILYLSTHDVEGINLLRTHLKNSLSIANNIEGNLLARRRHIHSLELAAKHLNMCYDRLVNNSEIELETELLAEELRLAQNILSEITGEFTSEDLLQHIFSNFCIGK